jgi:hypothetical protein
MCCVVKGLRQAQPEEKLGEKRVRKKRAEHYRSRRKEEKGVRGERGQQSVR